MHKLLTLLAAATLALPTLSAADAPAAGDQPKPPGLTTGTPPTAGTPPAESGDQNRDRGREGFMRRMVEEHPELKGVDLQSPEGQEKIREVMAKRMEKEAPKIRQRMADSQAIQHAELNKALGMPQEEFDAIKPLLVRVESLRMQKGLVDNAGRSSSMMVRSSGQRSSSFFNPQMMLGDTPLDPSVLEVQESVKALKALVDDKQANATELASAVARLRKARQGYDGIFAKAQEELRSVLTPQQEAILVDNGTLE